MNIIKTLKSSISEKGNYCYSLPVETTKEIIKDVKQLQQQNQKYKEVINKANNWVRNYMDEWSINDEVWQELNELLILLEEVE